VKAVLIATSTSSVSAGDEADGERVERFDTIECMEVRRLPEVSARKRFKCECDIPRGELPPAVKSDSRLQEKDMARERRIDLPSRSKLGCKVEVRSLCYESIEYELLHMRRIRVKRSAWVEGERDRLEGQAQSCRRGRPHATSGMSANEARDVRNWRRDGCKRAEKRSVSRQLRFLGVVSFVVRVAEPLAGLGSGERLLGDRR
jgi:hypothetical protein